MVVYGGGWLVDDKVSVERKLRFLEEQIIVLNRETDEIARLMVDKVMPMYKEYALICREQELIGYA